MKTIRIFISSPGDVAEERDKAKQVIAALQQRLLDGVRLIPVLWEDLAIPATASFQEGIDFVLAERHRIDIAVFILWSRLGSPLGAAIKKPDGAPYLSGTEREFDLMLAAFEQSGNKVPVILAYTRSDDEGFSNRLDATKQGDEALEELLNQRKLVKRFIRENFQDKEGRNLRAYHSYREPVGFAQRLHVHLRQALDDLVQADTIAATWEEAPYRSLEVFDIRHAPIFYGRDEESCDLLQRLRDQQRNGTAFVCIVGASGSGKSSLARAGVAATLLQRSFDDDVKEWRSAVFLASLASGDIFQTLARTLAEPLPELSSGVGGIERFAKAMEDQNFEAGGILFEAAFKTASDKLGGPFRLLLVLDQMEELWTDRTITPEIREKFLRAIEFLARTEHLSVLATLRSDFYPQAQLSETFLRMKGERGHFDLTPPGAASLQELIVKPAHRAGFHFERDERSGRTLDQRILEDAARDPSALPLLQYALAELYERRDEKRRFFTLAAYEAMGGVEGALGQRAAQTFEGLPAETQAVFGEMLPLLISVDITGEQNAVRRRAPLADITSTAVRSQLTERLIQARFLTTDERDGTPIASLAHEALLRRWDRVADWIKTNRQFLFARAHIEQNAAIWEIKGLDAGYLLPAGKSLDEAEDMVRQQPMALTPNARAYVQASVQAVQEIAAERGREKKRAAQKQLKTAEEQWEEFKVTGLQNSDEWRFTRLAEIETRLVDALALDPEIPTCGSLLAGIRRLLVEAGIKTKDLNLASIYLQKLKTMAGGDNLAPPELGQSLEIAWAESDPLRNKFVMQTRKWALRGCWMPIIWLALLLGVAAATSSGDFAIYLLAAGAVGTISHFAVAIFAIMMSSGDESAVNKVMSINVLNVILSLFTLNLISLITGFMISRSVDKVKMERLFWPKRSAARDKKTQKSK